MIKVLGFHKALYVKIEKKEALKMKEDGPFLVSGTIIFPYIAKGNNGEFTMKPLFYGEVTVKSSGDKANTFDVAVEESV